MIIINLDSHNNMMKLSLWLSLIYALFQAYSKLLQIKVKIKFAKARSMLRKLAQAFSSKKNVDNFTKYLFNVFVFCICILYLFKLKNFGEILGWKRLGARINNKVEKYVRKKNKFISSITTKLKTNLMVQDH
jgi:hypothetical protein